MPLNLCGIQAKVHNYDCSSSADVVDVVDFVPPSSSDGYEEASPRMSQEGVTDCSQDSDVSKNNEEILTREKLEEAETSARPPAKKGRRM